VVGHQPAALALAWGLQGAAAAPRIDPHSARLAGSQITDCVTAPLYFLSSTAHKQCKHRKFSGADFRYSLPLLTGPPNCHTRCLKCVASPEQPHCAGDITLEDTRWCLASHSGICGAVVIGHVAARLTECTMATVCRGAGGRTWRGYAASAGSGHAGHPIGAECRLRHARGQ
jgi:hypothetical protein